MPESVRTFYEPRFGADFSGVRVHTGSHATETSRSINARAFTVGSHIIFGQGQYALESSAGRKLLAHELVHTLQQTGSKSPDNIHRQLDPANTYAWDWYSSEKHRKDSSYLQTVNSAPGVASGLLKNLAGSEAPRTEEEREAFKMKVLTLIRLNAIGMVGEHRNQLTEKKKMFEQMATNPQSAPGSSGQSQDSSNPAAADTAEAIRAAALSVRKLNVEKEQLEDIRNAIYSAVRVNAGAEAINEEYQTLWDNAQPHSTPAILQKLLVTRDKMEGLSWGSKKVKLMDLRNDLVAFRKRQIQGIDMSLAFVYEAFPFFADIPAAYASTGKKNSDTKGKAVAFGLGLASITNPVLLPLAVTVAQDTFKRDESPDDKTLLAEVQASFDRIIARTDEAIVKVGSGGIDPLDLPGAVAATRNTLSAPLRVEFDRIQREHEVANFTREMILMFGLAVLTGLTGGAAAVGWTTWAAVGGVAAAGVGVGQLGVQLKDMLDRQKISAASTSPGGSLLGVSAPGTFEWTMFGVGALLTAVDLGSLAKEISGFRPHFREEPHLPPGKGELHPGVKKEVEPGAPHGAKPPENPDVPSGPGKKVQPSDPAEARIIEAGRGESVPSLEQIDSELSIVERSEPRKIPGGKEYVEEVELSNLHTWKKTRDGNWCRFSNGKICVPRSRGKKVGQTSSDRVIGQNITSEQDIDKIIQSSQPKLESPPPSVKNIEDQRLWELYNDYFAERVASMRSDIRVTGKTARDPPRKFDSFRDNYTKNPELLDALRGKLYQGRIGNVIDDLTRESGRAWHNLGISRVPDPKPTEMLYPDTVFARSKGGYTAVSTKSRVFSGKENLEELRQVVMPDIRESLEKYYGMRYVRRKGIDIKGEKIQIDEIVLNYDPNNVPKELRPKMKDIAEAYSDVDVKIGFFDFNEPTTP